MNRYAKSLVLIVSAIVFTLSSAQTALAHAHPKVMTPAPDSVGQAPTTISITFSEEVEPRFSSIQLTDEKGKSLNTDVSKPAPGDAKTIVLMAPALPAGSYVVHWVNVAVDGHRMEGEYKFTVQ
ncbi:MAG TPA: copper homeostasis periplasmic binding protein CopC [Granulicella sp.]